MYMHALLKILLYRNAELFPFTHELDNHICFASFFFFFLFLNVVFVLFVCCCLHLCYCCFNQAGICRNIDGLGM